MSKENQVENPIQEIYRVIREQDGLFLTDSQLDRVHACAFLGLNSAQQTVLPNSPILPFHQISIRSLLDESGQLRSDQEIFFAFQDFFLKMFLGFAEREMQRRRGQQN